MWCWLTHLVSVWFCSYGGGWEFSKLCWEFILVTQLIKVHMEEDESSQNFVGSSSWWLSESNIFLKEIVDEELYEHDEECNKHDECSWVFCQLSSIKTLNFFQVYGAKWWSRFLCYHILVKSILQVTSKERQKERHRVVSTLVLKSVFEWVYWDERG